MKLLELTEGEYNKKLTIPKDNIVYAVKAEDILQHPDINSYGMDTAIAIGEEEIEMVNRGYFLIITGGEYHTVLAKPELLKKWLED